MAELNPNAITGLGSKLNTREIVDRFMAIEQRRIKPVEARKEQKVSELEAWEAVKSELNKLQGVTEALDKFEIWEARKVETSDPDVIVPKARKDSVPGRHSVIVESVALSHQITSQGFESDTTRIGTGKVQIKVGNDEDELPITINLAEGKDTLVDLKKAINNSDANVEAYIAKTHGDTPYRLLLTSNLNGEKGRISIDVNLQGGEVEAPSYENTYEKTASWKGFDVKTPEATSGAGFGGSTNIVEVGGTYDGEEDNVFTFQVVRSGMIPSDSGVLIGWKDKNGREGEIEINKFNYIPGSPLDITDGLKLLISDGEVVAGDTFTVDVNAEKSDLLWWLSDAERAPKISQPSDWSSKASEGGVRVVGTYDGAEDDTVVFRVEGNGQVGGPSPLKLHYEFSESGEKGSVNIGEPYLGDVGKGGPFDKATAFDSEDGEELFDLEFSKKGKRDPKRLPLGHGLFIEVNPSVLRDGDTTDVDLIAPTSEDMWWSDEEHRGVSNKVDVLAKWQTYAEYEGIDDGKDTSSLSVSDGIGGLAGRISNASIEVSGKYEPDVAKTYTFVVDKRGSVGITRELKLRWEDTFGATGTVEVGEGYVPGTHVLFAEGLKVALGKGDLYEDDSFTISTETSTVRLAQDLVLRLGASRSGEGLEIRRSENEANDVIPGLDLEFFSPSKKPVIVSVLGDTEVAKERIYDFVDAYNTFQATAKEMSKFDKSTNTAAPLLSDRNLAQMVNEIATTTIATVSGLPQSTNMLFSIGLKIDDSGLMSIDEKKLNEKIVDTFSDVANLFRSHGKTDNPGVSFLGMTEETRVNPTGYRVDISNTAKRGFYLGTPLNGTIRIDDTNNILVVKMNGRVSDPIELRKDVYTPGSLAKTLQNRLMEDKVLGRRGIQVREEEGRLKIVSSTYGSNSTIDVEAGSGMDLASLGLVDGISTAGEDVAGSIGNVEAKGRGQLLAGAEDSNTEGLRIFVTLGENDLLDEEEATVKISKGVAVKLGDKLSKLNDPLGGNVKRATDDITGQMSSFDEQIKRLNKRAESKRSRLQNKFAKLDSTMGRLKSQQSYISQQLSAMGGGKKN
ncbi:MAG: flagellar filament capping protein FliD [SAR324 cluster bacterium]|uniref:Filament cap protein n=1 Tax=marine metagenome TaxID=408172 RepID=A0A381NER4_9ZZZZ|nr:flagellar filament capping protein FliD [SAR324 cluster bacterium]